MRQAGRRIMYRPGAQGLAVGSEPWTERKSRAASWLVRVHVGRHQPGPQPGIRHGTSQCRLVPEPPPQHGKMPHGEREREREREREERCSHTGCSAQRMRSPALPFTIAGASPWSVKLCKSSSGEPSPAHFRSGPFPTHRDALEASIASTISLVCEPAWPVPAQTQSGVRPKCRLAVGSTHGLHTRHNGCGSSGAIHVPERKYSVADKFIVSVCQDSSARIQRGNRPRDQHMNTACARGRGGEVAAQPSWL